MSDTSAPQLWLAAIDPLLAGFYGNPGSSDYASLATDPEAWATVVGDTSVFKISTQFADGGDATLLRTLFTFLNEHGIALAMEGLMQPVLPNGDGAQVEGYDAGPAQMLGIAQRIQSLGGTLSYIAMDEPLFFGNQYTGPTAAQVSIDQVAAGVATTIAAMRSVFPDVQVGDIEPLPAVQGLGAWLTAFQQATGRPLAFLDADVNWGLDWQGSLEAASALAHANDIPFGVIYNGDGATTSVGWTALAEQRAAAIEADPLSRPDAAAIIQTWDTLPATLLPEADPGTLTWLAREYETFAPLLRAPDGGVPIALATPNVATAVAGAPTLLRGISLSAVGMLPAGAQVTAVLIDANGVLAARQSGDGTVIGAGSTTLVLTGSLADVNAELASVTYGASATGTETIEVASSGGTDSSSAQTLLMTVVAPVALTPVPEGQLVTLCEALYGADAGDARAAVIAAAIDAGAAPAVAEAPLMAQVQSDVASLYGQVLNRAPGAAELLQGAQAELDGAGLASLRGTLATGPEAAQDLATAYASVLGETLDVQGLATLEAQLAAGGSILQAEGPAHTQAVAAITGIYHTVAGRDPDPQGLAAWSWGYLQGLPLADIREAFATSPEAASNLDAAYQASFGTLPDAATLSTLEAELASGTSLAQVRTAVAAQGQAAASAAQGGSGGAVVPATSVGGTTTVTAAVSTAGTTAVASGVGPGIPSGGGSAAASGAAASAGEGGAAAMQASATGMAADATTVLGSSSTVSTLATSSAGTLLFLGGGDAVVLDGGPDTVVAGTGTETVFAAASVVAYGGRSGSLMLIGGAAPSTVVGGGGSLTVYGSSADGGVTYGGTGPVTMVGGAGSSTFVGGAGPALVYGGIGGGTIFLGPGGGAAYGAPAPTTIVLGQGVATVTAADGNVVFAEGAASDVLIAGAGNVTLNGATSSGADLLFAGSGRDVLLTGSGGSTVFAGGGAATVTAGGATVLAFVAGRAGGTCVVQGFDPQTDHLTLQGYGGGAVTATLSGAHVAGGGTQLRLSDGTGITLLGVTGANAGWFI